MIEPQKGMLPMALVRKSADPRSLIQNCLNQDGYQTPLRVPLLGLQDSDPI